MRMLIVLSLIALPVLGETATPRATDPVVVPGLFDLKNAKDPVDEKPVAEGVHADWRGVRIHFAKKENVATFRKHASKYVGRLGLKLVEVTKKEDGKETTRTVLDLGNAKCPVDPDESVDGKRFVEKNGVRIGVCCGKCERRLRRHWRFAARPLGYAWIPAVIDLRNTTCPVSGSPASTDARHAKDVEGIRVQLCCGDCAPKLAEDKEAAFRKLGVEPERLKREHRS